MLWYNSLIVLYLVIKGDNVMKNVQKGLLHLVIILAVIALCTVTVIVGLGKHHKGSR